MNGSRKMPKTKPKLFFKENQKLLLKYYDDQAVDNQWNDFNFWKIGIEDVENLDYDILGIDIGVNDLYAFHDPQAQVGLLRIFSWSVVKKKSRVGTILDQYKTFLKLMKQP